MAVNSRRVAVIGASAAVLAMVAGGLAIVRSAADHTASPNAAVAATPPPIDVAEHRPWDATLITNTGDIQLLLYGDRAPQAVASFITLARQGFYDHHPCHRLTTAGIYVLQCGDPTGTGTGGPTYNFGPIENAPHDDIYPAGTLAMARRGGDANSMGSQFFLVYADSAIPSDNAGGYTVFGRITSGLDILEAIASEGVADGSADGRPAVNVVIEGVEVR